MKPNIDYIFVPKADINEGISSGTITKATLYFTKEYLFVLPFESLQVLLGASGTNYNNTKEFVADMDKQIPNLDPDTFINQLISYLPEERIYKISALEKFSIQVGIWIFGGMRLKKKGHQLQSFNIQPKALREQIKVFYGL